MWKFGRLEAEAKMRRVVQAAVRDGEEAVAAAAAADLPPEPPKREKKSMFGSIVGSISKQFAAPTPVEKAVAAFKNKKLDAIEAMGKIFQEEGQT